MRFSTYERTGVGSGIGFGRTFLSVFPLNFLSHFGEFSALFLLFSVGFRRLRLAGHCLGISIYRNPEPYPEPYPYHQIIGNSNSNSNLNCTERGIRSHLILYPSRSNPFKFEFEFDRIRSHLILGASRSRCSGRIQLGPSAQSLDEAQ